jgi:hypothetical protein
VGCQVLLGYREIPEEEQAIVSVLNPEGLGSRLQPRAWNQGDGRIKLLSYRSKQPGRQADAKGAHAQENATEKNALER